MGGKYLPDGMVREIRLFGSEQFCYLLPGVRLVYQNKHFGLQPFAKRLAVADLGILKTNKAKQTLR